MHDLCPFHSFPRRMQQRYFNKKESGTANFTCSLRHTRRSCQDISASYAPHKHFSSSDKTSMGRTCVNQPCLSTSWELMQQAKKEIIQEKEQNPLYKTVNLSKNITGECHSKESTLRWQLHPCWLTKKPTHMQVIMASGGKL